MNHHTDSHPSEARLMAYVDGELGPDERAAVSGHLVECDACARRLSELRTASSLFSDAAAELEPPPSGVTAAETRRRTLGTSAGERAAEGAEGAVAPEETGGRSSVTWSTAARIAASLVVLLGAAAALPGSPVRSWIDRSVQQIEALLGGDEGVPAAEEVEAPAPDRARTTDRSGVAVSASEDSILVSLRSVPRSTAIHVRLVDGSRAGVWNAGGEYRTAPGRIEVTAPASDSLLVEIPRLVGVVLLDVNDRRAAVARGGNLDVQVPDAEPGDGEFTFRPSGTN